jgi:FtsH-binding integral membrane protein
MSQSPFGSFGFAPGAQLGYRSRQEELTVGQFFNAVYAWMCVGLATTAAVAYGVATYAPQLMNGGVLMVSFVVQLVLVVTISSAVNKVSTPVATVLFVLYSALVGFTFSILFRVYAHATLAAVFLETAGLFGAMSVFGYVTKRDLSRLGSFLFMALIGIVIASLVNMFMHSGMMYWIISYVGIIVFVGLTAVDTQRLKAIALQSGSSPAVASRLAIVGSLTLYLDFINLFIFLLRVMGNNGRRV